MQTKLPRPARWPSWSAISAMDPDLGAVSLGAVSFSQNLGQILNRWKKSWLKTFKLPKKLTENSETLPVSEDGLWVTQLTTDSIAEARSCTSQSQAMYTSAYIYTNHLRVRVSDSKSIDETWSTVWSRIKVLAIGGFRAIAQPKWEQPLILTRIRDQQGLKWHNKRSTALIKIWHKM